MIWLLSKLFSVETLGRALSKKEEVIHMSIMTSADIDKMHKETQSLIGNVGEEMMNGIKRKYEQTRQTFN